MWWHLFPAGVWKKKDFFFNAQLLHFCRPIWWFICPTSARRHLRAEINLSWLAEFKDIFLQGGWTCAGCRFLSGGLFSTLHSVVSSVDRISYHEAGVRRKQKHSSRCLIQWAATVNIQRGGKDNFPQGRLPGTTLDHRLPSSPSSPFMNKNAVSWPVLKKKKWLFIFFLSFAAQNETLTFNSGGMTDALLTLLSRLMECVWKQYHRGRCVHLFFFFFSCRPADNLTV